MEIKEKGLREAIRLIQEAESALVSATATSNPGEECDITEASNFGHKVMFNIREARDWVEAVLDMDI